MTDGGTPIKTPARNSIPRTRKLSTAAAESEKPAQAPAPPDDARHRPSTANAPVTRAESTDGHPVSEQPDTPPQQTNFPKLAAVGTGEVKIVPGSTNGDAGEDRGAPGSKSEGSRITVLMFLECLLSRGEMSLAPSRRALGGFAYTDRCRRMKVSKSSKKRCSNAIARWAECPQSRYCAISACGFALASRITWSSRSAAPQRGSA